MPSGQTTRGSATNAAPVQQGGGVEIGSEALPQRQTVALRGRAQHQITPGCWLRIVPVAE